MIERYAIEKITELWSDDYKLNLWQKTELAVIQAMATLGQIDKKIPARITEILKKNSINLVWWKERDDEIHHDLNAFLDERLRFLPSELQVCFHRNITSYDTEEPAFARMLKESIALVKQYYLELNKILEGMAFKYRFVIMNGRTHGQEAELQTFGKRCLAWIKDLRIGFDNLVSAEENLKYSKLSGAIGNYGSINPELESEALKILGFEPFYGATQIIPREIYAPIAQALCQIVLTLDKIAIAIRLGARSGRPIYQEPFSKKQKGSSAMPHKKNTISTEQIKGMGRIAKGFMDMIIDNIKTWEERAIEQSSVERIAWPDLFHIVVHSLKTMTRVLKGLVVYPDNMLLEIIESRSCYASSTAKEVLKELGEPHGLTVEECYRLLQLAAFNAFEPSREIREIRNNLPKSLEEADRIFTKFLQIKIQEPISIRDIRDIIAEGKLRTSFELGATEEVVKRWNRILKKIFKSATIKASWYQIFLPSNLLQNEKILYQKILGVEN